MFPRLLVPFDTLRVLAMTKIYMYDPLNEPKSFPMLTVVLGLLVAILGFALVAVSNEFAKVREALQSASIETSDDVVTPSQTGFGDAGEEDPNACVRFDSDPFVGLSGAGLDVINSDSMQAKLALLLGNNLIGVNEAFDRAFAEEGMVGADVVCASDLGIFTVMYNAERDTHVAAYGEMGTSHFSDIGVLRPFGATWKSFAFNLIPGEVIFTDSFGDAGFTAWRYYQLDLQAQTLDLLEACVTESNDPLPTVTKSCSREYTP